MSTETKPVAAEEKKAAPPIGARKAKQRTHQSATKGEKLVCRYCGSDDLAPSFKKRRDARCRACFKKRYGAGARQKKQVPGRKTTAAK